MGSLNIPIVFTRILVTDEVIPHLRRVVAFHDLCGVAHEDIISLRERVRHDGTSSDDGEIAQNHSGQDRRVHTDPAIIPNADFSMDPFAQVENRVIGGNYSNVGAQAGVIADIEMTNGLDVAAGCQAWGTSYPYDGIPDPTTECARKMHGPICFPVDSNYLLDEPGRESNWPQVRACFLDETKAGHGADQTCADRRRPGGYVAEEPTEASP